MEPDDDATDVISSKGRTTTIGSLIATFVLVDAYLIGVPLTILSAWTRPWVVFVVAAVGLSFLNVALCSWLDHNWDAWFATGSANKVEKRLEKLRASRTMRHPVSWISRGSDAWFALAAAMINAITVIALARIIGGKPVGRHRVLVAGIAYSLFFAALFSIIGVALGDVIRSA